MGIKESTLKLRSERKREYKEASRDYGSIFQSFDKIIIPNKLEKSGMSLNFDNSKSIDSNERSTRHIFL